MPIAHSILNIHGYKVERFSGRDPLLARVRYVGEVSCPHCNSIKLRKKSRYIRVVRHESVGLRSLYLKIRGYKYHCQNCLRYFNQRFPGILPYKRSTEFFRYEVFSKHNNGISQSSLAKMLRIGAATIERWYHDLLKRKTAEFKDAYCPKVLGIDEHFFSRKKGYATTMCDLRKQKVFDITLGRSERSLDSYLKKLKGKDNVRVVAMDLAEVYRSVVKKYFPNALIVADRFHVIRLINHHFLKLWQQIDPEGRKNRGLLSLMRRHYENLKPEQIIKLHRYFQKFPAIKHVYFFKQKLTKLLLIKHQTKRECRLLIPKFLNYIEQPKNAVFEPLVTLGKTLDAWKEEIARMWRFTKSNGITEGFHNKMKLIQKRAYGFKNFENYRLRVRALCC